jgi:hypothetical protein
MIGLARDIDAFFREHRRHGDLGRRRRWAESCGWRATVAPASRVEWTRPTMPAEIELDAEAVTFCVALWP